MAALQALLRRVPSSFWTFASFGVFGFLIDVTTLYAFLYGLEWSPLTARIPAFLLSATFTWYMNRRFTFGAVSGNAFSSWIRFLGTNLVGMAANMAVYSVIILLSPAWFWIPAVAAGVGSCCGLLLNYTLSRRLVFV